MERGLSSKYRVNWTNGMKINKNHFVDSENSILHLLEESVRKSITPLNFGLLPMYNEGNESIDVSIAIDGQNSVEVTLNRCIAITLGGSLININGETKKLLEESGCILKSQYNLNDDEEKYIVLTVNPYKTIPVGNSDIDEVPPRHPFALPEYSFSVLSKNEINEQELGLFHITLGKIVVENGTPQLDENFIPPCSSIQSHKDLRFTYSQLSNFFNQVEGYCMNIIQKIHQKKQTNDLANMVLHLSQRTMQYLNEIISEYRLVDKYEPPVAMVSKQVSLARTIKSSLDVYVGTGKEELLTYLTDWCDLNQGAFENVLIDMINLEYVHTDINESLLSISSFSRLMLSLFKKLSELDFIGKKESSNIFVKQEVVENKEVKSRRSFLLD